MEIGAKPMEESRVCHLRHTPLQKHRRVDEALNLLASRTCTNVMAPTALPRSDTASDEEIIVATKKHPEVSKTEGQRSLEAICHGPNKLAGR